jgi:REP element-mobilizing transposase RayT
MDTIIDKRFVFIRDENILAEGQILRLLTTEGKYKVYKASIKAGDIHCLISLIFEFEDLSIRNIFIRESSESVICITDIFKFETLLNKLFRKYILNYVFRKNFN